MKSVVKQGGLWLLVAGLSLVVVSDVHAWPFRRRYRSNNSGGYSTNYGSYNTGTYAPAMPNAAISAPGVDVNTGSGGASLSAPGVGVNAGPRGAAISAPGVGVNAGPGRADVRAPGVGVGADANVRVRGQSPDVTPPPAP